MKAATRLTPVVILAAAILWVASANGDDARAKRTTAAYALPQVQLSREDGKRVTLQDELRDGRPAVVTFIFTSCSTICPVISRTLARFQQELGPDRDRVHILSISIDPEEDTPARLAAYGKNLHAGPEWHHYTGTIQDIITTARAFNVYRGDKMSHTPVILLRTASDKSWIRFDGFVSSEQLVNEIRSEIAHR